MSRATPTRAPWLATPLIALATFLGLYGLSTMLEMGPWMRTVATVLAAAAAVAVVTRLLSRSKVLPTLLAALASAVLMVSLFARDDDGGSQVLPTPGALADLGRAVRDGVDYAATTVAPAPASLGLTALITSAAVALFLVAEHIGVSWRAAASAGLVLLIPWLPAVIFQHRVSSAALIAAIVAWLLALALTRQATTAQRRPALAGAFAATAATMATVLLVAPTALGGLGWGMIPRFETPSSLDAATRLNLDLDLRTSLTTNSATPVIVYSTSGRKPDALKLFALTDFDGVRWDREDVDQPGIGAEGGLLWPVNIDSWQDGRRQRIDVQVLNLVENNVPLPPAPRTLDIDGPWFYDSDRDEVRSADQTTRELAYSVVTDLDYIQPRDLRDAQDQVDTEDLVDPRYVTISPAIDEGRVRDLTAELTQEATTRYDQAMAIQQYLRDPSQFTYDTSVSPSGGDAVSTFLDDRTGYCVQFATTMVMMARSLDIPARMAVGFLGGSATEADTFVVQGGDAHAWPELWFPDVGWVRFEPTPAVQTGAPPRYADPFVNAPPVPQDVLDGGQAPAPTQAPLAPTTPPQDVEVPTGTVEESPVVPEWVLVLAAAALVAGAGAWWWLRRSRGVSAAAASPEDVWERLREDLPEPMRWADALTPHEAAEHVEAGVRAVGSGLSGAGRETLTRLAHAVADHRYAPDGAATPVSELEQCADAVLAEARQAAVSQEAASRG